MEKLMYRTGSFGIEIKEVTVIKETDSFILIKGKTTKSAKRSSYENYHESFEAAYKHIEDRYNSEISRGFRIVDDNKNNLERLKSEYLTTPTKQ